MGLWYYDGCVEDSLRVEVTQERLGLVSDSICAKTESEEVEMIMRPK